MIFLYHFRNKKKLSNSFSSFILVCLQLFYFDDQRKAVVALKPKRLYWLFYLISYYYCYSAVADVIISIRTNECFFGN